MKQVVAHPQAVIELDHRAEFLVAPPAGMDLVAASSKGHLSLIRGGEIAAAFTVGPHLWGISAHPARPWLFIADGVDGSVKLTDLTGKRLAELPGPVPSGRAAYRIPRGLTACCYDPLRNIIWCAGSVSDDLVSIRAFDGESWRMLAKTSVADPHGESYLSFCPSSDFAVIALFLGGGQDGLQVCLLNSNGDKLLASFESKWAQYLPPAFPPSGTWCLVTGEGGVTRLSYPEGKRLAFLSSPWRDEEGMGFFLACLDDRFALVSTGEGIIYLLDALQLRILAEVIIRGHEPQPAEEIYPTLGPSKDLCTRFGNIQQVGAALVIAERWDDTGSPGEWKDRLVVVPVEEVIAGADAVMS